MAAFVSSCAVETTTEEKTAGKLNFSELSETFEDEGSFTALEILANVSGEKTGYSLKEIKDISNTSVATLGQNQTSIDFETTGAFTASLVFEHATKDDAVIDKAPFKILETSENILSEKFNFSELSKRFTSGGSFTALEILANVVGEKTGYSLKEIKDISDTSVARISGNKKRINFIQAGTFTATLILEHTTKEDVTIPNATFQILRTNALAFNLFKRNLYQPWKFHCIRNPCQCCRRKNRLQPERNQRPFRYFCCSTCGKQKKTLTSFKRAFLQPP